MPKKTDPTPASKSIIKLLLDGNEANEAKALDMINLHFSDYSDKDLNYLLSNSFEGGYEQYSDNKLNELNEDLKKVNNKIDLNLAASVIIAAAAITLAILVNPLFFLVIIPAVYTYKEMEKADLEKERITNRIKYLERPEAIDDAKNNFQQRLPHFTIQANTKQANTNDYKPSHEGGKSASQPTVIKFKLGAEAKAGLSSTENTSKVRQKTESSSLKPDGH